MASRGLRRGVHFRLEAEHIDWIGRFRSQPTPPSPPPGLGGCIFPVEGTVGDVFRWVRWPCPALRPAPLPRLSRTVGPPIYIFPFRPGQRGIAPLCVRPPYQPRRQVELAERHVLHAVGPPAAPGRPVDTPALDVFVDVLQNSSDVSRHRLLPPSSQSRSAAQR